MIRRTVARAFGPSGEERSLIEATAAEGQRVSRIRFLNQLFTELQEAFERSARERSPNPPGEPGTEGAAGESPRMPPLEVTKARPRAEGLEFTVQGPAGSYRFINAMDGIVWIWREEGGRFREDRLVTIHFEGESPRAIERPAGVPRAPFRFTSVPQLVREFLRS